MISEDRNFVYGELVNFWHADMNIFMYMYMYIYEYSKSVPGTPAHQTSFCTSSLIMLSFPFLWLSIFRNYAIILSLSDLSFHFVSWCSSHHFLIILIKQCEVALHIDSFFAFSRRAFFIPFDFYLIIECLKSLGATFPFYSLLFQ